MGIPRDDWNLAIACLHRTLLDVDSITSIMKAVKHRMAWVCDQIRQLWHDCHISKPCQVTDIQVASASEENMVSRLSTVPLTWADTTQELEVSACLLAFAKVTQCCDGNQML